MRPVRAQEGPVREQLRRPVDVHGEAASAAAPWNLAAPESFQPTVPRLGPQLGGIDTQVPAPPNPPAKKRRRGHQHCTECGHLLAIGPYAQYHIQSLPRANKSSAAVHGAGGPGGPKCRVDPRLRRVEVVPSQVGSRKFGGPCDCTGDGEHPGGCKQAAQEKAGAM